MTITINTKAIILALLMHSAGLIAKGQNIMGHPHRFAADDSEVSSQTISWDGTFIWLYFGESHNKNYAKKSYFLRTEEGKVIVFHQYLPIHWDEEYKIHEYGLWRNIFLKPGVKYHISLLPLPINKAKGEEYGFYDGNIVPADGDEYLFKEVYCDRPPVKAMSPSLVDSNNRLYVIQYIHYDGMKFCH